MYKCSAAPFVSFSTPPDWSVSSHFNLIYAQLLFTVRGRSCAEGGAFHEESVQGEGGGG